MGEIETLRSALIEEYKQRSVIDSISEKIKVSAEKIIYDKYKDRVLVNEGLEFELEGVHSEWIERKDAFTDGFIHIVLAYFCTSKLIKSKKERLDRVKKEYQQTKKTLWCIDDADFKIPIWKNLRYEVDIVDVLANNINLEID